MTVEDAADSIRDAVGERPGGAWADIGAGSGTFTEALASLLDASSTLIAMDRDAGVIGKLNRVALPG